MKPQFALDLSHTGIRLLQNVAQEEVDLGTVSVDDPAFEERVYTLYKSAEERAKGRVRSLLLIPNSEVLYTRVQTGPGDREARNRAVSEALVGMTPYDIDDLVFDWRPDGEETVVAAVARQTLEEAEGFAVQHGFNPLAFSARPVNGAFKGRPNFGKTKLALARQEGAAWPAPPQPPEPKPVSEPQPEAEQAIDVAEELPADSVAQVSDSVAQVSEADFTPPKSETAAAAAAETVAEPAVIDAPAIEPVAEPVPANTAPEMAELPSEPGADSTPAPAPADLPVAEAKPAEVAVADAAPKTDTPVLPDIAPDPIDAEALAPGAAEDTPMPADAALAQSTVADQRDGGPLDEPPQPAVTTDVADTEEDAKPKETPAKKRGAGRASTARGRKTKSKRAANSESVDSGAADSGDAAPLPAFSSRRRTAPTDGSPPTEKTPEKTAEAGSPGKVAPPRPAFAPPPGTPLDTLKPPTPPRPKIPPHLAKKVPGPKPAAQAAKAKDKAADLAATAEAPGKTRLSSLMSRLQRVPDGGEPLTAAPASAPPPRRGKQPKPAEKRDSASLQPPKVGALPSGNAAPVPPQRGKQSGSDFPAPPPKAAAKPGGSRPKVARLNGALPDQTAAVASLGPVRKAGEGAVKVTPPPLPDRSKLNEAESMTLFGARGAGGGERSMRPVLIGIAVVLLLAVAVWAGVYFMGRDSATTASDGTEAMGLRTPGAAETAADAPAPSSEVETAAPVISVPETVPTEPELPLEEPATPEQQAESAPGDVAPDIPLQTDPELAAPGEIAEAPSLRGGDTAPSGGTVPDAATVALPDSVDGPLDSAQPLPVPGSRDAAVSRYAASGIWQIPPDPPSLPEASRIDDMRVAALDASLGFGMPSVLDAAPDLSLLTPPATPLPPAPLASTEPEIPAQEAADETPAIASSEAPSAVPTDEVVAAAEPEAVAPEPAAPEAAAEAAPERDVLEEPVQVTAGSPSVVPPDRPGRPESLRSIVPINPTSGPDLRPRSRPDGSAAPSDGQQDTALEPDIIQRAPILRSTSSTAETPGTQLAAASAEPATTPGAVASLVPAQRVTAAPAPEPAVASAAASVSSTPAIRPVSRPETVARLDSDVQTGTALGLAPVLAPPDDTAAAATPRLRPLERPGSIVRRDTDPAAEQATTAEQASAAAAILTVPSPPARPLGFASLVQPKTVEPEKPAEPAAAPENAVAPEIDGPLPESAFAVATSRKPKLRPKRVEQQAARKLKAASGPAVAAAATVKPSGPTKASVAKNATEANMINLARLNLIGVYGSASDRRALVRLPSGRFVKVKVGDRVDGGRVASIGDDELRYVKGGRNIKLEMPKG